MAKPSPRPVYGDFKHKHKPSPVDQSALRDTDLSMIVRRAAVTGLPPAPQPVYGDFTAFDFHEAQNLVLNVKMNFEKFPARVRSMFDNDPRLWLSWIEDPKNHDEAVRLGMLPPLPPDAAQKVKEARQKAVSEQVDLEEAIEAERSQRGRKGPQRENPPK